MSNAFTTSINHQLLVGSRRVGATRVELFLFVVVCAISAVAPQLRAADPAETRAPADKAYTLIWSDEFNNDGRPDPKNWGNERGFVRNEELQWYQPENAFCEDGMLVIEGRRERVENNRYDGSSRNWRRNRPVAEYTSACLTTQHKQTWTHGRFEIRARFDAGPGLWPAIWTLGTTRGWPACGEIDIFESYQGELLANVCWANEKRRPVWDATNRPLNEFGRDWNRQFHIWQLDWTADLIKISVDGETLNETSLD